MNIALRTPAMTRDEFLHWVQRQELRYEFDGFQPVPVHGPGGLHVVGMGGASLNHNRISQNVFFALRRRLGGSRCEVMGADAAIATSRDAIRYPDALVTCTKGPGTDLVIPEPVIVFEVLSPSSSRTDRIVKTREYQLVPSIRRYVILEYASAAASVFSRSEARAAWTATTLTAGEILDLPEIGISVPLAELYESVDLPEDGPGATAPSGS